ncbi:MAG: rhomboid family intramembrane serine protease [Lachnospiraceae bacterium]|nr:rhomboid family intramembrane serine protease [Lachnospiraceae bacterium]
MLLHSTQSRVMLESTVLNFNSQMLSHASEDNILFLLVTDDIERDKHFVRLPNINLWMIEEEERQLQIYDEMPDDFYGMRYGIEKTLIAGKTNAWGTVGTTTRATSSRGTTSASTSSVSAKRMKNKLKSFPFVTVALIAINVIWFIVLLFKGDPSKASYMAEMGASYGPYVFEDHQFWRILTSMFMHFNFQHLLGNMIYLGIAGFNLEKTIGHVKYILIYMLSGIGAGLLSCAYYYFTGVNTVCAGASGAIYGLIGAVIVLTFKSRGRLSKSMMWVRIGIVLLFLFYSNFTNSQVDAVAHIAGFLFGIILTLSFYGGRKKKT